jgi:hypothetical protein
MFREPPSTLTWQYSDVQGQVSQVTAGPYNPSLPQLSQFPTKTTWTSWSDSFVMVHVTYVTFPRNSKPHGRYGFYLHVYGDPAAVIYQVPYGAIWCHMPRSGMKDDSRQISLEVVWTIKIDPKERIENTLAQKLKGSNKNHKNWWGGKEWRWKEKKKANGKFEGSNFSPLRSIFCVFPWNLHVLEKCVF